MLKEMNKNEFLFQKINYTFTSEYKDFIYKEKYIKTKENLLEYVYFNKFKNDHNYIQDIIIKNPNITLKIINNLIYKLKNIQERKFFDLLSYNKIDIYIIIYFESKNWNSTGISNNQYLSIEDIFRYPFINWDYMYLLRNPNVTMEIFESIYDLYKHDAIDYLDELSFNPNLTIDIIEKYDNINWDWDGISGNIKKLSLDDYIRYIEFWDHSLLSINIDFKIFDKYPNQKWNYIYLSENDNLDIDIIIKHLNKKWNWSFISKHNNITIDIIKKYPNLPWCWEQISSNKNINISFIKENLNKNWDIHYLSANSNITMNDIKNNNFNWDINGILLNPNIDKEHIEKYKNHENFSNIYYNAFLYDNIVFNKYISMDRDIRKNKIKNIFNNYIASNLSNIIIQYVDYY